jgi:uncharacterized protein YlxW (UPF0749 family)
LSIFNRQLKLNTRDNEQYASKIIARITMKDTMELLDYLITNEAESIEKMLHISKVDKRKILRLQNKLKALEKDIRKHKQSVKEYRNYLRSMSESIHTRTKLNPARKRHPDMAPEITQIKSVGKLEK